MSLISWTGPLRLGIPTRNSMFDQNFGMDVFDDFLNPSFMHPYRSAGYIRPWRSTNARESGLSNVSVDNNEFKVNLDVQQFRPEEVTVKIVDNFVVVAGKHEERRDDHGYVCRSFQRRYLLPSDVDQDAVKSTLSTDGVLSITAPKLVPQSKTNERKIPILQTNVLAIDTSKPKAVTTAETEAKAMDE